MNISLNKMKTQREYFKQDTRYPSSNPGTSKRKVLSVFNKHANKT